MLYFHILSLSCNESLNPARLSVITSGQVCCKIFRLSVCFRRNNASWPRLKRIATRSTLCDRVILTAIRHPMYVTREFFACAPRKLAASVAGVYTSILFSCWLPRISIYIWIAYWKKLCDKRKVQAFKEFIVS